MKDFKVAVIGAGLMGGGIAQTCAQAGYEVVNIDFYAPALDKARSNIEKLFDRKIAKGTITEGEKAEIMDRLTYSCDFGDVKGTGIVIEAVPEKMEIKKDTFKKVDELADPDTIIVGIATSDDTYGKVRAFAIDIKKEVADCPELPGFIVNRILVPMMNEAAFLVMEGCKPEDVDKAMKLGANHPMGPLELCDFVGVDIMLATITGLYNGFRDSKYRPCPILENMVKAGHLGRKTGQGFYQYI